MTKQRHEISEDSLLGKTAEFEVFLDQAMIDRFSELSGDRNMLHISDTYASSLGYPSRVAHGMLLAGFVSRLVGEYLPGGDALLLSLKIDFHKPTHPNDRLLIHGIVVAESPATQTLEIKFNIRHQRGTACKGTVLVQKQIKKVS